MSELTVKARYEHIPALGYKIVWRGPEGFEPAVVSAKVKYKLGERLEMSFDFGAFTLFDSKRAAQAWRSSRPSSANHAILLCEYEELVPKRSDSTKYYLFYRLWTYFKKEEPETGAIVPDKYLVRVQRDLPPTSLPFGTVFAKSLTPKEVVL